MDEPSSLWEEPSVPHRFRFEQIRLELARRWYTHLRVAQAGHKRMVPRGAVRRGRLREYHRSMVVRLLPCMAALFTAGACLLLFAASARVTPSLSAVKSWAFQLQNVDPVEIKLSPYDLVVLDYGFDSLNATAFPREIVDLMRLRPDGSRRLVLAYLNIGEAEEARYYWRQTWFNNRPDWLEPEDTDSPGVYRVKYWDPAWQAIVYGTPKAYLDRILDAGFDGVYIDGADKVEYWKRKRPGAASEMVALIATLAAHARAHRHDFMVIAQNGDALLNNPEFLRSIDGFAREDLLYSEKRPEVRNPNRSILDAIRGLRSVVTAGKPVFVIEYTNNPQLAASMLREINQLGFIGYVAERELKKLSPPVFGCGQPDCSR
jgi:cysteinyl-tRNA synthetase